MAALVVLLVSVVGVRMVGRPVQELVEKTRRIAAGDLSGPVHVKSRDEFRELADSINDMCAQLGASQERLRRETAARIQAIEQLRHADRLRTVGRLAAGIAHELGTPLNVVAGRAGLIASGKLSAEDVNKSAGTIKTEADRMTGIIRQLLDFARRSTPRRTVVDLRQVVSGTADLLAGIARKRNVQIVLAAADAPLTANVDVGQLQQVLTNLIMNAVQAMPQGGTVELALDGTRAISPYRPDDGEADFVCISVKDSGAGIASEHLEQIFEPFFTTKDVGEGTGLGLSISYGIVQEHGGWIDVASETDQGTCFFVYVPQEPPA
jgi:signal transduction histidine kinase